MMPTDDPYPDLIRPHQPRTNRRHLVFAAALAATAIAALPVIGYFVARGDSPATGDDTPTILKTAKEACAENTPAVRLGDGGESMTISRVAAEEDPGASLTELACILDRVDVPDAVVAQMDGTRALDGRQQATWDTFSASWTYHPDDGVNVILQEIS